MPGFNQTGPAGQGPMTGRRMGRCTNFGARISNQKQVEPTIPNLDQPSQNNLPESNGQGFGFGRGQGFRGRGMGRQNRFRGGF